MKKKVFRERYNIKEEPKVAKEEKKEPKSKKKAGK